MTRVTMLSSTARWAAWTTEERWEKVERDVAALFGE